MNHSFQSLPTIHAKIAHYCFYLLVQCSKNAIIELTRTISRNADESILILTQSIEQVDNFQFV